MLTRSTSQEATFSPNDEPTSITTSPLEGTTLQYQGSIQEQAESDSSRRQARLSSAADRLAQLDEEIVLEQIRVRELQLAHLKKAAQGIIPAASLFPNDDNVSVLGEPSKNGDHNHSVTIIKTVEKDLLAKILDTSEKAKSFAWLQLIAVYIGHGGRQNPWSFLHSQRRKAFEKYLSKTSGQSTTAGEYYDDMVYTSADTCIFIKDYIGFVIQENHIKEDDFLNHCVMKESLKFDAPGIRDYILAMMETIDMFSHFNIPTYIKVQKLVLGIQPASFRDMVTIKNRAIFTFSWDSAVSCIEKACQNEEDAYRHFEQGHGRIAIKASEKVVKDAKTKGNNGYECSNCHKTGHNAGQCDKPCTRCSPSCGELPNKCPVFLKHKASFSINREERSKQMKKVYKASNAALAKASIAKTDKKVYNSCSLSILPNAHSGSRPKRKAMMKPPAVTTNSIPQQDNTLIDFGCNGNFLNHKHFFDRNTFVPSPSTMVNLPDSSGVTGSGTGLFCGQQAHFLPQFEKSLICSEFFTDHNCAVVYLDDEMYISA